MKMETKLKIWVCAVAMCLLIVCQSVTAEEVASNAKDVLNMTVYESDEIEWQVVWQDEIGTATVEYGEPKVFWIVIAGIIIRQAVIEGGKFVVKQVINKIAQEGIKQMAVQNRKIVEYLLKDPSKSGTFRDVLGYSTKNPGKLADDLVIMSQKNWDKAIKYTVGGFTRYRVDGRITGPSGATRTIRAVWQKEGDELRLITAHQVRR